ncbi:MerR family transcriptional regulator [uncultured Modestobacter sp.]|uniref:MerR family transcriptional regulator n=1 Tax=uncultured Modestobacter sp. TaxID=380048 RepID=UPI002623E07C|nr:MerR family transcriptional regulator [uncultured Modestobacter sp.]
MRISEVSRRSGVPATALRYYETVGLITARRAANGYRDYDEDVLARLDLIEASKELGLPLEEIARHLEGLQTRSCTEVRDSLRPLLAEQLRQIEAKRARLERLSQRLRAADAGLAACPDRDDLCSSECALNRPLEPSA